MTMTSARKTGMSMDAIDRTPIYTLPLSVRGYCHHCLCKTAMEAVYTLFLSYRPLVRCVRCNSTLQDKSDALRADVRRKIAEFEALQRAAVVEPLELVEVE